MTGYDIVQTHSREQSMEPRNKSIDTSTVKEPIQSYRDNTEN